MNINTTKKSNTNTFNNKEKNTMKKLFSIIISITMIITVLSINTSTTYASQCYCDCGQCTDDEYCECYCGYCDWCDNGNDEDDEDYGDDDEDENSDDDEDENSDDDEDENGDDDEDDAETKENVEGLDPQESDSIYTDSEKAYDRANLLAYQYCGDSMFWYIRNNTLYIFGDGQMYNYTENNPSPWNSKSFEKVIIRPGIKSIGNYAFYAESFSDVDLPSTVTKIGSFAFSLNPEINNLKLGKDLVTIGSYAFSDCNGLTNITINNNLKSMEISAFSNCTSLISVRFPSTLSNIPKYAFSNCTSLSNAILREGLLKIDESAFTGCYSLSSVNIPTTLNQIGNYSFKNCSKINQLDFSESVNIIGTGAFENCITLNKLDFGYVSTINHNAFKNSGLKNVTLPASLSTYYNDIFSGCKSIDVYVKGNADAYKFFKKLSNLNVICKEHDNKKMATTKATFNSNGISDGYYCLGCGAETGVKTVKRISDVSLSKSSYSYNGKTQTPSVKVLDSSKKTISSSNYTITYSSGRKNVGKYTVTITFKGNYSGKKVLTYCINPAGTSLSSLTASSKGFKAKWKKQSTATTGYQIQYSTSSKFSSAKTVTVNKSSTLSKSITKLSGNKKYYVRVRTYKTVNKKNYYSSWSSVKSVTTKK